MKCYKQQTTSNNQHKIQRVPLEDKTKTMNSHRVLNYEIPPPVKLTSNFREININNMIQSPYSMKTMTQATPLTGKMEMHNWLYDKIGQSRSSMNSMNRKVFFSKID